MRRSTALTTLILVVQLALVAAIALPAMPAGAQIPAAHGGAAQQARTPKNRKRITIAERKAAAAREKAKQRRRGRQVGPKAAGMASTLAAPTAAAAAVPGGAPNYLGPEGNWAFSPQPTVTAATTTIGNPLIARAYATDFATAPGTLGPVLVVLPRAVLPTGTLEGFQTYNQGTPGNSPTTSEGNLFHGYVLRPTGAANQYQVVYDSGVLTVPPLPLGNTTGQVETFVAGPFATQAGDVIAFYGEGIPVDLGVAANPDILSYPANTAPLAGTTLTIGSASFPLFSVQDRIYSFGAQVSTGSASGGIRKFVDSLPGLGAGNANNLGTYIPVATPDTTTYPGSDYYEIELGQFTQKMHSDLKPTTLRGYRQANMGGTPYSYLGPTIVATKDRPVRIKFTNKLPTGTGGNLFLPVDTTMMGAGMGPLEMNVTPGRPMNYTQNRATLHLHGGNTVWVSDGTQHQWITPAGENTDYPRGVSVRNVPDMPDPGPGAQTFFYSNQQSARLMFYHDHAYGITRLNVYAGEAAGYLLTDQVEQDLIARGIVPDLGIPLIIQDKTFVDPATVLTTDPTWPFPLDTTKSNLWYPHVYMPNQNPNDLAGVNAVGRWDYGPWFWPPWPATNPPTTLPDGTVMPNLPNLSSVMEAFMDTPLVNGTAYPYMQVQPKTYRFRILNGSDDRFWNLQLLQADPTLPTEVKMVPADNSRTWPAGWPSMDLRDGGVPDPALLGPKMIQIGTEGGFLPAPVVWPNTPIGFDRDPKSMTVGNVKEHNLFLGPAERADVLVDFSQFAGKTLILYNDAPAAVPANDPRLDYYTGNPNLVDVGGNVSTLPGYGPNTRTVMQIRVASSTPAAAYNLAGLQSEFASTAAKAGVFARSADPIIVPQAPYNSAYNASFPAGTTAYERIQSLSLTFNPLNLSTAAPGDQVATAVTIQNKPKAIAEEFENTYGRMSAFLGVEVPFTNGQNQTTIFYSVIDPVTEILDDTPNATATQIGTAGDGTQIWKITHNGVDTHPIHFHLFNVQLINRVDWAGVVKPPEPNELGWKETVRMNPLEDTIVALRPVASRQPFGVPDSVRPLDPTMPIGSTAGFKNVDANGNPIVVTNQLYNFGWEYVWHCHILSHEEMDMMRPMQFNVGRALPVAPVLSFTRTGGIGPVSLAWTDGTPASAASTLGNPANEIGFRIERATIGANGQPGAYSQVGTALANATSFVDSTADNVTSYSYRVVAYNAAGDTLSNAVTVAPAASGPAAPTLLAAALLSGPRVSVTWRDNATNETGFVIERSVNGGAFATLTTVGARTGTGIATYIDTTVAVGNSYSYRVKAISGAASSAYSNTASVSIPTLPAAPSGVTATAARAGTFDSVTIRWTDNANNETSFTIQRSTNAAFTTNLVTVNNVPANATSYTQTGVPRRTNFYYRIRAVNAVGNSAWVNATPAPIFTP